MSCLTIILTSVLLKSITIKYPCGALDGRYSINNILIYFIIYCLRADSFCSQDDWPTLENKEIETHGSKVKMYLKIQIHYRVLDTF